MRPSVLILPLLLAACTDSAMRPRRLTGARVSPAVWGVLELPRTPGPHPAVVLVPGSYGFRPDYARFARAFADSGFVALAIDYYAVTGKGFFQSQQIRSWPVWQETIRNAVAWLDTLPAVSGMPVGLVGYSRGAFLSISVGASTPGVGAVVDYYGGGPADSIAGQPWHFPPLLILHGEADNTVSVSLAHLLHDAVLARGGEVEMQLYPRAGHAFNGPWSVEYSETDATDAWRRTIDFLRRRLVR